MTWQAYRWIWRLEAPLHVGLSPAGSLNRTRLYIPARAMWGALTATLARQTASGAGPNYQGIGKDLQEKARFSYLYPAEQANGQWQPWLPRYEEGQGLCWQHQDGGNLLPDRFFRQRLLSTHPGTAIDPASDTAAEGTLREVEYILPRWRDTVTSVALVGYVFLRDGDDPHGLKDVEELWIGGESRYGFGHLRRVRLESSPWQSANDCFGIPLDLGGDDPILQHPQFVYAHTLPEGEPVKCGAWEIVLGWDQDNLYTGTSSSLCWVPGSRVKETACYRIPESGVWEKVK
jgi:hypothetical protein